MFLTMSEVVRFEVFTAVTMKNGVFWDVTPCGTCKSHMAEHPRRHHSSGQKL
jgi:cytidine deaminase